MAVFAPMPSASERIAAALKPGFIRNIRSACRTSPSSPSRNAKVFIFSLDGYSIHTPEGLDGEEIESVCELKGLTLRRTHAEFVYYTLPDQRRSSRKGEKQFLILENQG